MTAGREVFLMPEIKMNPKLKPYIPIVRGIALALGRDYEVNLHDLSIPEHSIVAIENGHVTGRKIGSPMTDFGLYMMKADEYRHKDGVFDYLAQNSSGNKMKCSCIFIRDEQEKMIGFLCINYDISRAEAAREFIDNFLHTDDNVRQYDTDRTAIVTEGFANDLSEVMQNSLSEVRKKIAKPFEYLAREEKELVVKELNDRGYFLLKGAVELLAGEMKVTKYTVYSYLRKVQDEEKGL